jgi:hypothetical protein
VHHEALCAEEAEMEKLKLMKSLSGAIKQDFLTRFEVTYLFSVLEEPG